MYTDSPQMAATIQKTVLDEFRSRGQMLRARYEGGPLTAGDLSRVMADVELQIYEAAVNCRRRLAGCTRVREARRLSLDEQVELVEALKFAAARARSNATYEVSLALALRGARRQAHPKASCRPRSPLKH